jgi:hypothetical protein
MKEQLWGLEELVHITNNSFHRKLCYIQRYLIIRFHLCHNSRNLNRTNSKSIQVLLWNIKSSYEHISNWDHLQGLSMSSHLMWSLLINTLHLTMLLILILSSLLFQGIFIYLWGKPCDGKYIQHKHCYPWISCIQNI